MHKILLALLLSGLVAVSYVSAQSFAALCGTGSGCSYLLNDKFGFQTVEVIRQNFNAHQTAIVALQAAAISPSSTTTFTNKTIDAEGTGNLLTVPFTLFLRGAQCEDGVAYNPIWDSNATDQPTWTCQSGSNTTLATSDFPDPGPKYLWQHVLLPADWTGAIDVAMIWSTSATSGNVVWQIQTACSADGETIDPAWNTASTVTDAAQGTTNRRNSASITGVTATGCAASETLWFRLVRDGAHASDTLAASARLIEFQLTYRRVL